MNFQSILFPDGAIPSPPENVRECFQDLNLDQVWRAVAARRPDYDLTAFFSAFPRGLDAVLWRQEIFRDLEDSAAAQAVRAFSRLMRTARERLVFSEKSGYRVEQERWFLGGAEACTQAVRDLDLGLAPLRLRSRGLNAFRDWLNAYTRSEDFVRLDADTARVSKDLAALEFCVFIQGDRVTVSRFEGQDDLAGRVEATFSRFRRSAVRDYTVKFGDTPGMNHIEAQITERAARAHPGPFQALERHRAEHADFLDATLARFETEAQFYLAVLEHWETLKHAGLDFNLPRLSDSDKSLEGRGAFDLALARKLSGGKAKIVRNDFELEGVERVLVVSGPNQGGKTTFARTLGQMHVLAALGCPVPGVRARLFLCDRVFTHFERGETVSDLRSKLEDDLVRVRDILGQATPRSLIIINEIFSSAALKDALYLGRAILDRILGLDALCVCVTFLEELASLSPKTVSMVSSVDPADPAERTFRLERRPADGMAHALALARKHGVTGEQLRARLQP